MFDALSGNYEEHTPFGKVTRVDVGAVTLAIPRDCCSPLACSTFVPNMTGSALSTGLPQTLQLLCVPHAMGSLCERGGNCEGGLTPECRRCKPGDSVDRERGCKGVLRLEGSASKMAVVPAAE